MITYANQHEILKKLIFLRYSSFEKSVENMFSNDKQIAEIWRENEYAQKSADVNILVSWRDVSSKIFNKNELKNILTKCLALNNLTIKMAIIQEYLIQNVLKRKKMKQSDWL